EPDYTLLPDYEEVELSCDGKDNNCNGFVDEHLVSEPANQQEGVCAGVNKVCDPVNGGWVEPDYSTLPHYEADETLCDDLDNDCDGVIDEPYGDGGTVVFTDLDGTTDLVKGDVCG